MMKDDRMRYVQSGIDEVSEFCLQAGPQNPLADFPLFHAEKISTFIN